MLEIDRLRHHAKNGVVQHGKRPKVQTGSVETFLKDLEDERNYWKSQVSELQQLLRSRSDMSSIIAASQSPSSCSRSRSRSASPSRHATRSSPTRRGKTVSRGTSPTSPAKKVGCHLTGSVFCCFYRCLRNFYTIMHNSNFSLREMLNAFQNLQ